MSQEIPEAGVVDRFTIADYWLAIYRQRVVVLIVTIVAALVSLSFSRGITPRYEEMAQFYVPTDVSLGGIGGKSGTARLPSGVKEHAKAYLQLLRAEDARRVIAQEVSADLETTITASDLQRDVDLNTDDAGHIRVYARSTDAEMAAKIANRFVSYFNDFHRKIVRQELDTALQSNADRIAELTEKKAEVEVRREAFMRENLIGSVATAAADLEARRQRAAEGMNNAQLDVIENSVRLEEISTQLAAEDSAYESGDVLVETAVISGLKSQIADIEIELASRAVDLMPAHPTMVALQRQLDSARSSLLAEVTRIVESESKLPGTIYDRLRENLIDAVVASRVAEARLSGAAIRLEQVETRLAQIPQLMGTLRAIDEELGRFTYYMEQAQSTRQSLIARELNLSDVVIIVQHARAAEDQKPIFPNVPLNVLVATVGGLVVGVLYALLLAHIRLRSRTVRIRGLLSSEWGPLLAAEMDTPDPREGRSS